MFAFLGTGETIVILIVGLLVFGGRLPEVSRSIGKAFVQFKREFDKTKSNLTSDLNTDEFKALKDLKNIKANVKQDIIKSLVPDKEPLSQEKQDDLKGKDSAENN